MTRRLTAFATIILLIKLELIGYTADLAAETILPRADLRTAGMELAVHAAGGLLVLLMPAGLSVYKPRGLTPYGRRTQQEQRAPLQQLHLSPQRPALASNGGISVSPNGGSITITLRRVQMFGLAVVVLVMHIFILHLTGTGFGGH